MRFATVVRPFIQNERSFHIHPQIAPRPRYKTGPQKWSHKQKDPTNDAAHKPLSSFKAFQPGRTRILTFISSLRPGSYPNHWEDPKSRTPLSGFQYSYRVNHGTQRSIFFFTFWIRPGRRQRWNPRSNASLPSTCTGDPWGPPQ